MDTEIDRQCDGVEEVGPCCCFDVSGPHNHEFVYAVIFEKDIVKIGRTANPSQRISQLISESSLKVIEGHLFAVVDSRRAETVLLEYYREFRINGGEWFLISEEVRHDLSKSDKWTIGKTAYWPYCAHMTFCALCKALEEL